MYCDPPMVRKPAIRADKPELTASNNVSSESNAISPICVPVTQIVCGVHKSRIGSDRSGPDPCGPDFGSDHELDHGSDYGSEQVKK